MKPGLRKETPSSNAELSVEFNAGNGTLLIGNFAVFQSDPFQGALGTNLDSFSLVSEVPEPSRALLLLVGAIPIPFLRRRRR